MKVKALEALGRGKALVSSSVGVQGFPPQARELLAVEDDPQRFAAAAAQLLIDAGARAQAERRAAAALSLLPTWDEAAGTLGRTYDGLADGRGLAPREVAV
jgi:predicted Zn-dependent protease